MMGAKWIERNKRVQRSIANVIERETAVNAAVEEVVQTNAPTLALPSWWQRTYDNRTAAVGEDTTLVISPGTVYGGLIRLFETDKRFSSVGVKVTVAASGSTVAFALYGVNLTETTARGLAGDLVADFGTVSTATTGFKSLNVYSQAVAPEPGYYWLLVSPSHEITINGFQSFAGHLGRGTTVDEVHSGFSDLHDLPYPASMTEGTLDAVAPLVYFKLDAA